MNENLVKDELKVKRKNAFRELLKESNVNVTSNWKEIRRKIKDDVRYQKYRHSLPLKLIPNHLKNGLWSLYNDNTIINKLDKALLNVKENVNLTNTSKTYQIKTETTSKKCLKSAGLLHMKLKVYLECVQSKISQKTFHKVQKEFPNQ